MASVLSYRISPSEKTKVEAFDEEWKSIGVFESLGDAARKLFIRSSNYIWAYLYGHNGITFKGEKRGVKSYKTGKRYHFKKVTNE